MSHESYESRCGGEEDGQTVIEVTPQGDAYAPGTRFQFRFQRIINLDDGNNPRIVISASRPGVGIAGVINDPADLAALRDALLSLPDSAFEVPPPAWVDGDVVARKDSKVTYIRARDQWRAYGTDANLNWWRDDKGFDTMLKFHDHKNFVVQRRGGEAVEPS